MVKIGIEESVLHELLGYHTNYIKGTVSENWNHIVGTSVKKRQVTSQELSDIDAALNRELAKKIGTNSPKLFLQNIVEICTTQDLGKYAISSETLFPHPQDRERYVNILLEIIGYKKFNQGVISQQNNKDIKWNRHTFVQELNVRVCPYCNRQYITSFYKDNREMTTADVDHYYPKTQFPLLSMNFFNLVPSCSVCNSRLKGRKKLGINDITLNPFFDGTDSLFFTINNDTLEEMCNFHISDIKIFVKKNKVKNTDNQKRAENSIKYFYLPQIYSAHVKEAAAIRENINRFSKDSFEKVFQKNYSGLFADYEEFKKVIFYFNYLNDGDEPLVKLRKDIYAQLMSKGLEDA